MSKVRAITLMAGTSALFLGWPALAYAQETAEAPQQEQEVVVTGTRIVRNGYTAPTPVTVAPVEELVKANPTNLPDALSRMPQFNLSTGAGRSSHNFTTLTGQATHGNVLNLRGVGGQRALILFDGLRVPPTTYIGAVDVNVIPNLLIDRVDVVTAGASAAYGSDAVSGVVNFVLDRDFTGVKGVAQYGISDRSDNENYRLGAAWGVDINEGRGHLLLSAETFDSEGFLKGDRPNGPENWAFLGATPGGGTPGSVANPFTLYSNTRLNTATFGGLISGGTGGAAAFNGFRFQPNGSVVAFNPGTATGTPAFVVGGDGFYLVENTTAAAPVHTDQFFARFSYEITPNVTAFAQGIYAVSETSYQVQANGFFAPAAVTIFSGNPYIPANVQAAMSPTGTFLVAETLPWLGPLRTEEQTNYFMATVGLEGKIGNTWTWNAAYVHGSSQHEANQFDIFYQQHFFAAVDAVRDASGNIVCRVTLTNPGLYPGCQPINIMGQGAIQATAAGLDYVTGTLNYEATNEMDILSASVQGDLFTLPAGPLTVALGAERREQSLKLTGNSDPAELDTAAERAAFFQGIRGVPGSVLKWWLTNIGRADGDVEVSEAFAEVAIPILKDVPLFYSLDLNAAGRVTDYSTSGQVETWKYGFTWRPVEDILVRATQSRDIAAPNLFQLFAGPQSAISFLVDPHTGVSNNVPQVSAGNPTLDPEVGDTKTIGVVLTPSFLPGLSLSVDWYELEITGAIATPGLGQVVTDCETSGGTADICSLITRPLPFSDRSAANFPTQVALTPQNLSFIKTSGIDFDASYHTDLGPGRLALRLFANYLDEYTTKAAFNIPAVFLAGRGDQTAGRPQWRGSLAANYEVGGWNLFVQETYIGELELGSGTPTTNYREPHVDPVWYTDATVAYTIPNFGDDVRVFFTVNNLFDETPPLIPANIPGVNVPTIFSLYDTNQRAYTAGVRFQF